MAKPNMTDPAIREAAARKRICTCSPDNTPCDYCRSNGYQGPSSLNWHAVKVIIGILLALAIGACVVFGLMYFRF